MNDDLEYKDVEYFLTKLNYSLSVGDIEIAEKCLQQVSIALDTLELRQAR